MCAGEVRDPASLAGRPLLFGQVQRRFFLLGSNPQVSAIGAGMQTALASRLDASCEPLQVQPDARAFREALGDEDFIGMQLATRHSPLCFPLCEDYSVAALTSGVVDLIIRQPGGR